MDNMDWLSRIAPWLKDMQAGSGGGSSWFKDRASSGDLFGGGGWPFFGNAGQSPGTPPATGTPPTGGRNQIASFLTEHLFGGAMPGGGTPSQGGTDFGFGGGASAGGGRPIVNPGFTPSQGGSPVMRGFAEGGRPEPGAPAVVGEDGPEVFVPDQPGTVVPNWLADAMVQMPAPAPQPQQRGPLRSMAAGRQVADWRDRDPDAAMQGTKDKWADIYANPADTLESLGLTGQIIGAALRNASPNAAQAQSANAKKLKKPEQETPMDKVMEEQQFLADKGFYRGTIDGADGPATKRAREEYRVAQEKLRDQQLEERKLAIQEGQLQQGEKKTDVELKGADNRRLELEQAEAKRLADKERREKGEAALRESDKNLSWYDKMLRSYGPTIGGLLGAGAGVASRAGIKKLGDMYQASNAAKAEKTLEGAGGVVTKENVAERVGATNDWWRRGGAANEPFVATPKVKPGVKVNPNEATPIKELFEPSRLSTTGADLAGLSLFGAKGAYAQAHLPEAQAAFEKAKKEVDADASDVNIEAYQTAKSRLSALETLQKAAIGGGLSYPAYAMAKPRYPIKPPTNVAESEKLGIETFLRETAAEKAAKAAATRQANAAKKTTEKAPTPSLQELTAPEPIRAHVPKRTRKKAAE